MKTPSDTSQRPLWCGKCQFKTYDVVAMADHFAKEHPASVEVEPPSHTLCPDAWAIPPSPRMLSHGNDYYTCSICGEKVAKASDETLIPPTTDRVMAILEKIITRETHKGGYQRIRIGAHAQLTALMVAERIDELRNLPWKRSDKYGINTPYVTKTWFTERLAALRATIGGSQ